MRITLVTGLSGSGKSVALNVLEDEGAYCVDNLPASVLEPLVVELAGRGQQHLAVGIDARSLDTVATLPSRVAALRATGHEAHLIYLDADEATLVERFSETRRRHPLSDGSLTLEECIVRERELLAPLLEPAHRIDTTRMSSAALRARVLALTGLARSHLTLLFESFAFKRGLPRDADLVFDVRCLPNPHYDPRLRPLTGRDAPVAAFLEAEPSVQRMLADIRRFVREWLPAYVGDSRSYLTVAVGCTGGRHRSVYIVEQLARDFAGEPRALVRHRELPEAGA
ncbi:MAG: RNase adapter RapZ [Pseudomonadota bacterium]|jgi:UPF0042 nucleotide-binding protein